NEQRVRGEGKRNLRYEFGGDRVARGLEELARAVEPLLDLVLAQRRDLIEPEAQERAHHPRQVDGDRRQQREQSEVRAVRDELAPERVHGRSFTRIGGAARPARYSARMAGDVRFVEANGLRFGYLEDGAGPLVLLLHGFPDTAHSWDDARARLAAKGFRAVS